MKYAAIASPRRKTNRQKIVFIFISDRTDAERGIGIAGLFCFCCISIKRPGARSAFKGLSGAERKTALDLSSLGAAWSANCLREIRAAESERPVFISSIMLSWSARALQKSCRGWGRECCVRVGARNRNRSTLQRQKWTPATGVSGSSGVVLGQMEKGCLLIFSHESLFLPHDWGDFWRAGSCLSLYFFYLKK
jgi:hypothetical protein